MGFLWSDVFPVINLFFAVTTHGGYTHRILPQEPCGLACLILHVIYSMLGNLASGKCLKCSALATIQTDLLA